MGAHRWLLGPVICLIVAMAGARPPECEEAPFWSVGRRQPMLDARGKQATILESLRKHFRAYGMNDMRFMIVNSNLQHAQQIIHELQSRVSFDVYQDTKEQNIWGLLNGGKDDVYVYDRCGRLAYYIPYPLSIMNPEEGNLVTSAILATYYRSPCGSTCEKNSTTLEDFLNNVNTAMDTAEETADSNVTQLYDEIVPTQTDNMFDIIETNSSLYEGNFEYKVNQSEHFGYDYPTYDETLDEYDHNETNPKHDRAFFNSLYSFFFNAENGNVEPLITNDTIPVNTSSTELEETDQFYNPLNISEYGIVLDNATPQDEIEYTTPIPTPRPRPDRCAEADPSVCKNWSKKRLLRAHDCCSNLDVEDGSRDHLIRYCKNFGKKRCKKIKTILKCCIKTALYETPSTTTVAEEVAATTPSEEVKDVVCCREVEGGRLCRVAEGQTCNLDEYVQEDVPQVEGAPTDGRTM